MENVTPDPTRCHRRGPPALSLRAVERRSCQETPSTESRYSMSPENIHTTPWYFGSSTTIKQDYQDAIWESPLPRHRQRQDSPPPTPRHPHGQRDKPPPPQRRSSESPPRSLPGPPPWRPNSCRRATKPFERVGMSMQDLIPPGPDPAPLRPAEEMERQRRVASPANAMPLRRPKPPCDNWRTLIGPLNSPDLGLNLGASNSWSDN